MLREEEEKIAEKEKLMREIEEIAAVKELKQLEEEQLEAEKVKEKREIAEKIFEAEHARRVEEEILLKKEKELSDFADKEAEKEYLKHHVEARDAERHRLQREKGIALKSFLSLVSV